MTKSILILGGSSDIGADLTKRLLAKNFIIKAHYSNNDKYLKRINSKKLKLIKLNFEKLNSNNAERLIKNKFTFKYDIIINLVGYVDQKSFENTSLKTMYSSIKNNALIPFLIIQKTVKNMLKNNFGRIVNCSSIGVKFGGGKNSFNYSLSKHCLEFIPNAYKDWAKKNVLINNLRIGVTDTKIHSRMKKNKFIKKRTTHIPIGRLAKKSEISFCIANLINEDNSFMTNETITVSGGE